MKSLNVKIPLTVGQSLDDRGQLNPQYIKDFVQTYLNSPLEDKPILEFTFNYTLKVDSQLHKDIKIKALNLDLPMNEFLGRLLAQYY